MAEVLIVVHLIIVVALTIVVLLQKSEGGGLGMGSSGGAGGFMTARGTANVLTRTTAVLALAFFITSITLGVLATSNRTPRSILDQPRPGAVQQQPVVPGQPAVPGQGGGGGGILDQLNQMRPPAPPPPAPGTQPAPQVPTQQ